MSDKRRDADQASANRAAVTTGTRLDPWYNTYADRTFRMGQPEVYSFFVVTNHPEVISPAGDIPNTKSLLLEFPAGMNNHLPRDRDVSILRHDSGQRSDELREIIVKVTRPNGICGHANDAVITIGSQQTLDLISQIFINPDDVVPTETLSYVETLRTSHTYQANVVHVPMDAEGLVSGRFVRIINGLEAKGRPIEFLYTIPSFHGPDGICLLIERHPCIAEICRHHHTLMVEDDPYGLLGFNGDPIPVIQLVNPDDVVRLGSFPRTFAPGYRIS